MLFHAYVYVITGSHYAFLSYAYACIYACVYITSVKQPLRD